MTISTPGDTLLTHLSAYTIYAFFEWALVLLDVAFDAVTALDFATFELVVRDVNGLSRGYVTMLPRYSKVRLGRSGSTAVY